MKCEEVYESFYHREPDGGVLSVPGESVGGAY
jgi:hypothetical protein